MAEVLSVAAGVIQFVDIGLRVYSKLNRFCRDVRDAPQIIRDFHTDLRQQLDHAQNICVDHRTTLQPITSTTLVDIPLGRYINQIRHLDKLLEDLTGDKNDGLWQRGWKGVRTAKTKNAILESCESLERQKSSLSMWLTEMNLKLSAEVKFDLSQIHLTAQQSVLLAQKIEQNSSKTVAAIDQMNPRVDQLILTSSEALAQTKQVISQIGDTHQVSEAILLKTEEMCAQSQLLHSDTSSVRLHTEQILPQVDRIGASTQLLTQEIQSMRDDWSRFYNLIISNPALKSTMNRLLDQSEPRVKCPQYLGPFREWNDELCQSYYRNFDAVHEEHQSSMNCTCRSKNQTNHWQPIPMLHFKRSFRTNHHSHCPRYVTSDQSLELMARLLPPSWLFARSIDVSLQVRYWPTNKSFSISPIVIGSSRLVDTAKSLAFQAFFNTREKLKQSGFEQSAIYLPDLQAALHHLYQTQKASPFDQDYLGNTILHEVIGLYRRHQTRGVMSSPGGRPPGDEYISLIQFLLESGIDSNTVSIDVSGSWDKPYRSDGSPLDIFACRIMSFPIAVAVEIRNIAIYKKLVGNGCEFSQPFRSIDLVHPQYYSKHFEEEVLELRRFPEQIELSGHEHLVSVILQQSEPDFLIVVQRANINHASPVNGLTALHFAVEWPLALEYLIKSGANLNVQDHYRRRPIHLALAFKSLTAVNLLLQADCALETAWGTSLLQDALELSCPLRDTIVDAVVEALIDRHQRFLSHARVVLTETELSNLGVSQFNMSAKQVSGIKDAMLSHGFEAPPALELDNEGVYDTVDLHGCARMTTEIAERLWQAGFKDIHYLDSNGLTPLLQSWDVANFEMVAWLIEKGADEFGRRSDPAWSGLHMYASRIAYPGAYFQNNADKVHADMRYLKRLQDEPSVTHDECSCLCSSGGCTPTSILMKERSDSWLFDRKIMYKFWLQKTAPSPTILKQYSEDCVRLLVFESIGLEHVCCTSPYGFSTLRSNVTIDFVSKKGILENLMSKFDEFYENYCGLVEMLPFDFLDKYNCALDS